MKSYLVNPLPFESRVVADVFDEATLWAAAFGQVLLDNIPMGRGWQVLDVGFGAGFPLIELCQRFDVSSKIYGVDIWQEGIRRARLKADTLKLENVEIEACNAERMPFADAAFDLITSNVGINNFGNKLEVMAECRRVIKPTGRLCVTSNVIGTFEQFFDVFRQTMVESGLSGRVPLLEQHISHRGTTESVSADFQSCGFDIVRVVSGATVFRFVDGAALLNHSLVRIGFLDAWRAIVGTQHEVRFFSQLETNLSGGIDLHVPVDYFEFEPAT